MRVGDGAGGPAGGAPSLIEAGGRALIASIEARCEPAASFEDGVRRALAATLDFFAARPELLRYLGGGERLTEDECEARRALRRRCAELLRNAAKRDSRVVLPPTAFETLLIDGVAWQIATKIGTEESNGELRDGLVRFLLAYYPSRPS